jgi:hypothetical protein
VATSVEIPLRHQRFRSSPYAGMTRIRFDGFGPDFSDVAISAPAGYPAEAPLGTRGLCHEVGGMQEDVALGHCSYYNRVMRLKTELWVKAYIRQRQVAGAFAAVVAHGHDSAGAVLIKIARLDGTAAVYGPAPMSCTDESGTDSDRRFVLLHDKDWLPEHDVDAIVVRQRSYDEDIWVVEVEDRSGNAGLDGWLATPERRL